MESDFTSAFPFPPNVTQQQLMTVEERIVKQADDFCRQVRGALGIDVEPPPELLQLEDELESLDMTTTTTTDEPASSSTSSQTHRLAKLMYELMIECGLRYDKDPETGIMTPTQFDDIPSYLDIPEVQKEFYHLYSYGIQLITLNLLTIDEVKEIAQTRIIPRTGLEPTEFDAWLGF